MLKITLLKIATNKNVIQKSVILLRDFFFKLKVHKYIDHVINTYYYINKL